VDILIFDRRDLCATNEESATSPVTSIPASSPSPTTITDEVDERIPIKRVKTDSWHLGDRHKTKVSHPMHVQFHRRFRDALFILDPNDLEDIIRVQAKKLSIDPEDFDIVRFVDANPAYVLARCRRTIPPPHILVPRIEAVYAEFEDCLDQDGEPLFTEKVKENAAQILEHCRHGCVSDVPGIELYEEISVDKDGLMRYRCKRGMCFCPLYV
jgi:hypothetical protein